jgi:hypothetical protein
MIQFIFTSVKNENRVRLTIVFIKHIKLVKRKIFHNFNSKPLKRSI